jgi:nucleoside-diphosphate-sugar epimerase
MSDKTGRTAFVTGGTGQLGSHLAERLVGDGWRVKALVRPTSDKTFLSSLGDSIEFVTGDVTDGPEALKPLVDGADTVFQCAAFVDDYAPRDKMVEVNVTVLENVIGAARAAGARRFVYVSSAVVYGSGPQHDLDETAPYVHTGDNYNYTKICAEELALAHAAKGLHVVILRPPYIYGARDRQLLPRLVTNIRSGVFRYIGDGNTPFTLVWAGNVAEAMVRAAETEGHAGEVYNVTDGESITRRELVELISDVMGIDPPKRKVPIGLAKALVPVFELVGKITGKAPRLNRFKFKFMAVPLTFSIEKARRDLGYKPLKPPMESLREAIEWYRDNAGVPAGS